MSHASLRCPAGCRPEVSHTRTRVGSPNESVPPGTWTESGQTPVLRESSSRRDRHVATAPNQVPLATIRAQLEATESAAGNWVGAPTSTPSATPTPKPERWPKGAWPTARPRSTTTKRSAKPPAPPSSSAYPSLNKRSFPDLQFGEGLWRVGQRSFVVHRVATAAKLHLIDTNTRMGRGRTRQCEPAEHSHIRCLCVRKGDMKSASGGSVGTVIGKAPNGTTQPVEHVRRIP